MLIKFVIFALLVVVLYCLGSALYFMLKGKSDGTQMAKALTWRISLSLLVFILLLISFLMGWIHPHGLPNPMQ